MLRKGQSFYALSSAAANSWANASTAFQSVYSWLRDVSVVPPALRTMRFTVVGCPRIVMAI